MPTGIQSIINRTAYKNLLNLSRTLPTTCSKKDTISIVGLYNGFTQIGFTSPKSSYYEPIKISSSRSPNYRQSDTLASTSLISTSKSPFYELSSTSKASTFQYYQQNKTLTSTSPNNEPISISTSPHYEPISNSTSPNNEPITRNGGGPFTRRMQLGHRGTTSLVVSRRTYATASQQQVTETIYRHAARHGNSVAISDIDGDNTYNELLRLRWVWHVQWTASA